MHRAQRVVVRGDGIGDPVWVGVCINDADGGNVVLAAFLQKDVLLCRIETHNEIRFQSAGVGKLIREARDWVVVLIYHDLLTTAEDLLAIRDAAGRPSGEEMASFR